MDILTYVKSEKVFLKIQEGTGDNLSHEDIAAGYRDYVLWSTFRPECIDLDQTLDMENLDSGMVLFKRPVRGESTVRACYRDAFGKTPLPRDIITLMTSDDFE